MTLFFHLMWMLCALGTATFAAAAARDRRRSILFGCGFIAGVALSQSGLPDPAVAGALALGAAAIFLFKPRYAIGAAALAGVLAGMWSALLHAQGLPRTVAPLVAASLIAVSIWLARSRPVFAPPRLLDEGLLAIGALGIVAVTLPSILDGWQTAVALAATSTRQSTVGLPVWTTAFLLTCTMLGGVYAAWSRR
jgi:hypothetical protein